MIGDCFQWAAGKNKGVFDVKKKPKKQANTQPGTGENVVARTERKHLDKNTTKH